MWLKRLLFVLCWVTLCYSNNLFAQWGTINAIKIIPTQPTSTDFVQLVAQTVFPSSGCDRTRDTVVINSWEIHVQAFHTLGPLTVICNASDTFSLGQLPAGQYTLIYDLFDDPTTQLLDSDTLYFSIQQVSTRQKILQYDNIVVFPNPASSQIIIQPQNEEDKYSFELYSFDGRLITKESNCIGRKELITSDLQKGIYFLAISNITGKVGYQPIMVGY